MNALDGTVWYLFLNLGLSVILSAASLLVQTVLGILYSLFSSYQQLYQSVLYHDAPDFLINSAKLSIFVSSPVVWHIYGSRYIIWCSTEPYELARSKQYYLQVIDFQTLLVGQPPLFVVLLMTLYPKYFMHTLLLIEDTFGYGWCKKV